MQDANVNSSRSAYFLLGSLALIWGSSFMLMRLGLQNYTPIQIGCLRMCCAALVMTPFLIKGFRTVQPGQWKYLLVSGMFGNAIPSILFPLAQTGISSSLAGMINSLTPIFTLVLGAMVFGTPVNKSGVSGLVVGFGGAVLLIIAGNGTLHATSPVFPAYVVAATVCYAISVNVLRHKLAGLHPLTITSFALLFIGLPMGIYLFSTDFLHRTMQGFDRGGSDFPVALFPGDGGAMVSLASVFLLGVVGTAISTVLFNRLIQLSGALVASSVTYLIPVVATCWGMVFGETIGWMHLSGLGLVLAGVYLINGRKR